MIKAFILEDEPRAIKLLEKYLEQIDFIELVGSERTADSAMAFISEYQVDVLFLDINLPEMSGIKFFKDLSHRPSVIFTTAYPEYAVEGFELDAVDYLLKPITYPRFLKACEKLNKHQHLKAIEKGGVDTAFSDLVYVKSGKTVHKLFWNDILYLEKDDNYVIYHLQDQRILSRQTLNKLELAFPNYFCRVHKSFAVSLLHLEQSSRELVMVNGRELPVGRKFRKQFMDALAIRE